jgi:hypothetical protein
MAEEYISLVTLEVDGKSITDFKTVEEKEYELNKTANLMNHTGHFKVKPRYGVNLEYVIPSDTPAFDFSTVRGGKIVIAYENGTRVSFSGVYVLKIGATKYGEDKEATKTIEFSAKGRKEG